MNTEPSSCLVRSALALVLRLSILIGVTPARLTPCSRGYILQYSPLRYVFGCLFYGILCLLSIIHTIGNIVIHVITEVENSEPMFNAGFIFVIFVCALVVLDTVEVFRGKKHIKKLITMLNAMERFDIVTKKEQEVIKMDNRRKPLSVVFLTFYVIAIVRNVATRFSKSQYNDHVLIVSTMHHIGYFVMIMLALRFMFVALLVHSSFQSVNISLREIYIDIKRGCLKVYPSTKSLVQPEEIRRIGQTYSFLCDVVRELNDSYGAALLFTLCLIIYLFGWTGLIIIKILYKIDTITDISLEETMELSENVFGVIISVIHVVIIIEPCHRTHNEMQITKIYLIDILYHASTYVGPVVNELDMFYRLTTLERASYSPLKLCIMERSLALKMIAGMISYVIIVIQLDV